MVPEVPERAWLHYAVLTHIQEQDPAPVEPGTKSLLSPGIAASFYFISFREDLCVYLKGSVNTERKRMREACTCCFTPQIATSVGAGQEPGTPLGLPSGGSAQAILPRIYGQVAGAELQSPQAEPLDFSEIKGTWHLFPRNSLVLFPGFPTFLPCQETGAPERRSWCYTLSIRVHFSEGAGELSPGL